jgi:hypothetical protein
MDPRDRGYRIAVHDERGRRHVAWPCWATCSLVPSGWRLRYGATPEMAERRLRDWIEASG